MIKYNSINHCCCCSCQCIIIIFLTYEYHYFSVIMLLVESSATHAGCSSSWRWADFGEGHGRESGGVITSSARLADNKEARKD